MGLWNVQITAFPIRGWEFTLPGCRACFALVLRRRQVQLEANLELDAAFGWPHTDSDMTQHETSIAVPHDSTEVRYETTIPHRAPAAEPVAVDPCATDPQPSGFPSQKRAAGAPGKLYGMPLAWRGMRLLGVVFAVASAWYVGAWVVYGRLPLLPDHSVCGGFGQLEPILPPVWFVALLSLFTVASLFMMFLGTQDANPKMRGPSRSQPSQVPEGADRKLADPRR